MPEFVKNKGYLKKGTALFTPIQTNNLAAGSAINIFGTQKFNDSDSIVKISNTQIRLLAGRKYSLTAGILFGSDTAGDYVNFEFYNITTGSYVGSVAESIMVTYSTNGAAGIPVAYLEIKPEIDTVLELRTSSVHGIPYTLGYGYCRVEEVEAYLSVSAGELPYASDPEDIKIDGIQSVGILDKVPRADHVHPTTGDGIIEAGSNSNGRYIKFRDGTMIQWGSMAISGWSDLGAGYAPERYISYNVINYPTSFIALHPSFSASINVHIPFYSCSIIPSYPNVDWVILRHESNVATGIISWKAIGRWKA